MASDFVASTLEGLAPAELQRTIIADGRPAVLWSGRGDVVLWASSGAASVFGQTPGAALDFDASTPGLARLREFARIGAIGDSRRDVLRFRVGARFEGLKAENRMVLLQDGSAAILSLFGEAPAQRPDPFIETAASTAPDASTTPVPASGAQAAAEVPGPSPVPAGAADPTQLLATASVPVSATGTAVAAVVPKHVATAPATAEIPLATAPASPPAETPESPAQTAAATAPRLAAARPVRFVFQTDSEGHVVAISPGFSQALGVPASAVVGKSLAETVAAFDSDGAERLGKALASRGTWSGVSVRWPSADGEIIAPVDLSASPAFGPDRLFAGFSGFGVCRLDRARPAPPVVEVAPAEPVATPAPHARVEPAESRPIVAKDVAPTVPGEPDIGAPAKTNEAAQAPGPSAAATPAPTAPFAVAPVPQAPDPAIAATARPSVEAAQPAASVDEEPQAPDASAVEAALDLADDDEGDVGEVGLVTESPLPVPAPATLPPPAASASAPPPAAKPVQDNAPSSPAAPNVVPLKTSGQVPATMSAQGLSISERHAFREIARALGARFEGANDVPPTEPRDKPAPRGEAAPSRPERASEPPPVRPEPPAPVATVLTAAERQEMGEYPLEKLARIDQASLTPPQQAAAATAVPTGLAAAAESIVERIPVGIIVFRDEAPLYLNRPMLDMTGYGAIEEFKALGGLSRLLPGRSAGGLSPGEYDTVTIMGRDGQTLPVDAHLQTIDWDGATASMMTFRRALDAEQGPRLRTLEVEMKARRADLAEARAMLDTATDGVISLDDNGRILALNRSAEALFGYDQKELAGERFTLLLAPESHAIALDYLDGLRSGGVASVLNDGREVIGKERKGGRIPLFMTVGRVSETGKFAAVLRDMTAWKRAETELTEAKRAAERASALKSDFLAKISHEIRTPMNAIIGFAEVMRDERLGPIGTERYKEYLKDIHTSGEHVISLVNDLLDLSKIEAGRMDLTFGSVDLNAIVTSCLAIMQPQANRDRVIMRSQIFPKLPPVVADERSIRQIVLNLLSNASKFTEPGGQVIVSTALTEAGEAVIRVRDTGIGMTDSEVQAALEPFRQLSTTRHRGGTGLGLPLTKALVEANRAMFTIRSKSREGTLVEVTFPPTRVLAE